VKIIVYGKPSCGLCSAAKEKLKRMGLEFEDKEIESYTTPHKGWEKDESIEVMAAYLLQDRTYPIISIDGMYFNYPNAMKFLKKHRRKQK